MWCWRARAPIKCEKCNGMWIQFELVDVAFLVWFDSMVEKPVDL